MVQHRGSLLHTFSFSLVGDQKQISDVCRLESMMYHTYIA